MQIIFRACQGIFYTKSLFKMSPGSQHLGVLAFKRFLHYTLYIQLKIIHWIMAATNNTLSSSDDVSSTNHFCRARSTLSRYVHSINIQNKTHLPILFFQKFHANNTLNHTANFANVTSFILIPTHHNFLTLPCLFLSFSRNFFGLLLFQKYSFLHHSVFHPTPFASQVKKLDDWKDIIKVIAKQKQIWSFFFSCFINSPLTVLSSFFNLAIQEPPFILLRHIS